MKKAPLCLFSIFIILISLGLSRGKDLRVVADEARIYAEPDSGSYMIEKVRRGTILTLFQPRKVRKTWYYIAFYSERRKGRVSGFIQESMVEMSSGIQDAAKTIVKEEPSITTIGKKELSVSEKDRAEHEMPIMASPKMESVAFEKKEEKEIPSPIEIKAIPDFDPSSTKELVAFQEISEPPVEIKEKKMPGVDPPPTKKTEAFQERTEPPVKIDTEPLPSVFPSPTKAAATFKKTEETKKRIRVEEELMMTSVPKAETEKEGIKEHVLAASSQKEVVAYQERVEPPVEVEVKKIPPISPEPQMEASVFRRKEGEKKEIHPEEVTSSPPIKTETPRISKPQREIKIDTMAVPPQRTREGFSLITFGLGYGLSQGGAGGFLQFNTKSGFSIHGGVGYYPATYIYSEAEWVENVILFGGGIKYYLPLESNPIRLYINFQYGGIGVEAAQIITGIWNYAFVLENKQVTLWGPSAMVGLELRKGMIGLSGAVGLSYNMTELDWEIQDYFLTFDIGLLFYF